MGVKMEWERKAAGKERGGGKGPSKGKEGSNVGTAGGGLTLGKLPVGQGGTERESLQAGGQQSSRAMGGRGQVKEDERWGEKGLEGR